MHDKGYSPHKTDEEILEAIEEYDDIMRDGYKSRFGVEYGVDYAAWNISLCI